MIPACSCLFLVSGTLMFITPVFAATPTFPGTRLLESGDLVVEVGDPDAANQRWNTGVRFSPVANVIQVRLGGQTFCYAPVDGGRLGFAGGLPMEFDIGQETFQPDPPGYNEGRNGDPFLKIGVGILRRNASPYNFSSAYPVVELAKTESTWGTDRARFVQTLEGTANGYACRLELDLVVKNDSLAFHYVLINTGTREFTTEQYLHNFLAPLHQPVGPNYRVTFPYDFDAQPEVPLWQPPEFQPAPGRRGGPVLVDDNPSRTRIENVIQYTDTISSVPKTWVTKPEAYLGPDVFALEQTRTGQRVVIDSTLRSAYVGIWSTDYNVSPEQFIIITLAPGERVAFTRTYRFSKDGSLAQDCTGDQLVDHRDLAALSAAWLSVPDSPDWNPACDIDASGDDRIDNRDLAGLGRQWQNDTARPTPLAHWPLDESSGLVASDPMNACDGALLGFAGSQWAPGTVAGGLQFDGVDDYVAVENCPAPGRRQARTVTAWIKAPAAQIPLPIIAWGQADSGNYWRVEVDEEQRLRVSTGAGFVSAGDLLIGDDKWHHLAVVLDPADPARPLISDVLLYIDGERRALHRMTEGDVDTLPGADLRIGTGLSADNGFFAGMMDEVAVFDVVIGPSVVRQMAR